MPAVGSRLSFFIPGDSVMQRFVPLVGLCLTALLLCPPWSPAQEPKARRFSDVTAKPPSAAAPAGRGVALVDYDGDGLPDLFLVNGQRAAVGRGVAWADLDNDGFLDLFIANGDRWPRLFRNNGDGTFTDITAKAGLVARGAVVETIKIEAGDVEITGQTIKVKGGKVEITRRRP
jgi:hypothetical protein